MLRHLAPEVGDNKNRANYEIRISDILGHSSSGAELINCNVNRTKISSTEISTRSKQFAEWSRRCSIDSSLNATDAVIIVSYFLPVNLTRSSSGIWSASWDKENLLSLTLDARATYVGSVRYHGAPIPIDEEENVTIALLCINCHPIFIDQKTHYHFYDIFCKQSLWLLLHHDNNIYSPLKQADIGAKGQQDLWFTYSTVNRIFRDKVVEVFQAGNLVWVCICVCIRVCINVYLCLFVF
jgi:trehalose-6-phosphate synthase